jgi:putative transposase
VTGGRVEIDAEAVQRGRRQPESLYGSLKMCAHLRRQGIVVARCTVATHAPQRLPRCHPGDEGPHDLVERNFRVDRPDALYVADFT